MTVSTDSYIIGSSPTPNNNFLLDTDGAGGLRIRRRADGSGGLIATFDAAGNLQLGAAANANAGRMVLLPAKATTTGTSIDFLPADNIPSWAKEITMLFNGVGTNGSSYLRVQIGSGSFSNSGYASQSGIGATAGSGVVTDGFILTGGYPTMQVTGQMVLTLRDGNVWQSHSGCIPIETTSNGTAAAGRSPALAGILDRIRLTANGTDAFARGSVALLIKG